MLRKIQRAGIVAAFAAGAMLAATPAMARDRHHGGNGDDAAIAIGAGIVGLALGAAIASDRDRGYDRGDYYYDGPRYRQPPRVYYYDRYDAPRYRKHHRHYRDRGYYRDDRRWRRSW